MLASIASSPPASAATRFSVLPVLLRRLLTLALLLRNLRIAVEKTRGARLRLVLTLSVRALRFLSRRLLVLAVLPLRALCAWRAMLALWLGAGLLTTFRSAIAAFFAAPAPQALALAAAVTPLLRRIA